jgi:hypothetical protein
VLWYHEFAPPIANLKGRKSTKGLFILYAAYPALWLLTRLFKSQCNFFAFAVLKPDLSKEMFPWLKLEAGKPTIDKDWVETNFKGSKN